MLDKYKKMLEDARKDLQVLRNEQTELVKHRELLNDEIEIKSNQIKKMEETVISLSRLCNVELEGISLFRYMATDSRFTLTNAVRNVFKSDPTSQLIAIEVRDKLVGAGFDSSEFNNLLASIHTTLKRLAQGKELLTNKTDDGKTAYRLNPDYKLPDVPIRMMSPRVSNLPVEPFAKQLNNPRIFSQRYDCCNHLRHSYYHGCNR